MEAAPRPSRPQRALPREGAQAPAARSLFSEGARHWPRGGAGDRGPFARGGARLPVAAAARGAAALPASRAARGHRPRRGARARPRARPLAAAEGDEHARAVSAWLERFIVGYDICPWTKSVFNEGRVRVVTSQATSAEGVLEDIRAEADLLPEGRPSSGSRAPTTTLLVCPHVAEWKDFDAFDIFHAEELKRGSLLQEEKGLKLVAFHPRYCLYGSGFRAGDQVAVAGPNGSTVPGMVVDESAGVHPDDGEELLQVRFEDGEEYLVRHRSVVAVFESGAGAGAGEAANLISRAPRPVIHLLRLEDLGRAAQDGQAGAGPRVEAVLQRNEEQVIRLGADGVEEILRQCG